MNPLRTASSLSTASSSLALRSASVGGAVHVRATLISDCFSAEVTRVCALRAAAGTETLLAKALDALLRGATAARPIGAHARDQRGARAARSARASRHSRACSSLRHVCALRRVLEALARHKDGACCGRWLAAHNLLDELAGRQHAVPNGELVHRPVEGVRLVCVHAHVRLVPRLRGAAERRGAAAGRARGRGRGQPRARAQRRRAASRASARTCTSGREGSAVEILAEPGPPFSVVADSAPFT